jgi:hypothetical protein
MTDSVYEEQVRASAHHAFYSSDPRIYFSFVGPLKALSFAKTKTRVQAGGHVWVGRSLEAIAQLHECPASPCCFVGTR